LTPPSAWQDNPPGSYAASLAARWPNDGVGDGIQEMTAGIETQFDADEGHLRLDCSEEEFLRIRDLVVSGVSTDGRLGPFIDGIQSIVVRRTAAPQHAKPRRFRRILVIFFVWLALAASLGIQVVGIIAVIKMLLGHRS
jgi:hypothetical protein